MRHSLRARFVLPGLILLVGFCLRLIYLAEIRDNPFFDAPVVDAKVFLEQAQKIAAGDLGGGDEPFWQPPLYIYFLALFCWLFPADLFLAIRLAQIFLGIASGILLYLIARRTAGRRVALLATLMAMFYGPFLYFEGELLGVTLEIFLDLALVHRLLVALDTNRSGTWIQAGLLAGLAALARPNILLFTAAFLIWLPFRERRSHPTSWVPLVARRWLQLLVPTALLILPVTWRNYQREPDLVLISSNGGINFYLGNNADYERTVALHPGTQWEELAMKPVRAGFTTAAGKSAYFFRESLSFIRDHPLDYLLLLGKKVWLFWSGPELKRNQDIYYMRQHSRLLAFLLWDRGLSFPFGLIGPLSLLGLGLSWSRREKSLTLIRLFVLSYGASVVLFFVVARYRLPVLPALLIFAALGLDHLYHLASTRQYRLLARQVSLLAVLIVLLNLAAAPPTEQDAQLYFDLGEVYLRKGEYQRAVEYSRQALVLEPDYNYARHNLAAAYFHLGQYPDAIHQGEATAAENPKRPDTQILLGQAYLALGQEEIAAQHLRRALELDPSSGMAHYYYGHLLNRQGQYAQAAEHLFLASQWRPDDFWIHYELGNAYQYTGRLELALAQYKEAHRLERRPEAANAIGAVYLLRGELELARSHFEEALELAPDFLEAEVNLALLELRQGHPHRALARLEQLRQLYPHSPVIQRALLEVRAQLDTRQRREKP